MITIHGTMAARGLGCACALVLSAAASVAQNPAQDKAALAGTQVALKRAAVKAAEAQVDIAKAKLEAAKANVARARAVEAFEKTNLQRLQLLFQSKAVDEALLRGAEKSQQAAQAQMRATEALVAVGQAELARELARREMAVAELTEAELRLRQLQPAVQKAAGNNAQLNAMLKERHDLLHKAIEIGLARVKAGRGGYASLAQPQRDALRATLDLNDGPERLASLEKLEKLAAQLARTAASLATAGQGTESDTLQARAAHLEVRIALLREQAKIKNLK